VGTHAVDLEDENSSGRNQQAFIARLARDLLSCAHTHSACQKAGEIDMRKSLLLVPLNLALLLAAGPTMAGDPVVHQYVIERDIPGAAQISADELRAISRKSREVLEALGPEIKWQQSYVTEDKLYCIYTAPNKEIIRKHAELGGFPADRISEVSAVISPATAD
jgi:hypothetical protein